MPSHMIATLDGSTNAEAILPHALFRAQQEEITMTVTTPKTFPQANGDFYAIGSTSSEEDQALLRSVRAFLEAEVATVITGYWIREEFSHQLLPKLAELRIMGLPYHG